MFLVVFTFFFLVILLLVQRGLSQAGRDKVNHLAQLEGWQGVGQG